MNVCASGFNIIYFLLSENCYKVSCFFPLSQLQFSLAYFIPPKMGRLSAINCSQDSFVCFFVTRLGIFLNTISNSDSLFSQNFYFQKNRLSLSTGYCKTRIGCQRWLETLLEHVNLQIFQSDCGYSIVDSF